MMLGSKEVFRGDFYDITTIYSGCHFDWHNIQMVQWVFYPSRTIPYGVFLKRIPRSSIVISTITGGTYSPDFMYVVKRISGEKELNIIVETKDIENKTDLRDIKKAKIATQVKSGGIMSVTEFEKGFSYIILRFIALIIIAIIAGIVDIA